MFAIEIHTRLQELQAERALASTAGLAMGSALLAQLDGKIEATTRAYVGAAVTEMANLRAQLCAPQIG
jgi:hypothetical protein